MKNKTELAKKIGISKQQLSQILRGGNLGKRFGLIVESNTGINKDVFMFGSADEIKKHLTKWSGLDL